MASTPAVMGSDGLRQDHVPSDLVHTAPATFRPFWSGLHRLVLYRFNALLEGFVEFASIAEALPLPSQQIFRLLLHGLPMMSALAGESAVVRI